MAKTKRRDKSRVVLRTGESQRADGTYHYSWTDANRKRRYVYAKTLDELRYKEEQIEKDKKDGIKAEARYTTLNDMYELWRDLKRGLKNNTFENYKYMYETFVRNQIGSKTVSSLKKTDIKRFYNYLADERHLKPATIDNIHTVLHQILDMAVDDPYTTFRCVNSARDGWTATVGWLIKGDNFENGTYRLVYNGIAKRLVKAKMNYIPFSVESSPFKVGV